MAERRPLDLSGPVTLDGKPTAEEAQRILDKRMRLGVAGFRIWLESHIVSAQGLERATLEEVEVKFNTCLHGAG